MTAHKHAAMIKAKADNMDLVLLSKINDVNDNGWIFSTFPEVASGEYADCFLSIRKHMSVCLSFLRGREVQVLNESTGEYEDASLEREWSHDHPMMNEMLNIRVKPDIEKRWICITEDLEIEDRTLYESYADADENSPGYKQIVEIEIEIEV